MENSTFGCIHCGATDPQEGAKLCHLERCGGDTYWAGHRRYRNERKRRERVGNRLGLVLMAVLVLLLIALGHQLYVAAAMLGTLSDDLVRIFATLVAVGFCGVWLVDHVCHWYLERHPKHSTAAAFYAAIAVGAIYLGQYWGTL